MRAKHHSTNRHTLLWFENHLGRSSFALFKVCNSARGEASLGAHHLSLDCAFDASQHWYSRFQKPPASYSRYRDRSISIHLHSPKEPERREALRKNSRLTQKATKQSQLVSVLGLGFSRSETALDIIDSRPLRPTPRTWTRAWSLSLHTSRHALKGAA